MSPGCLCCGAADPCLPLCGCAVIPYEWSTSDIPLTDLAACTDGFSVFFDNSSGACYYVNDFTWHVCDYIAFGTATVTAIFHASLTCDGTKRTLVVSIALLETPYGGWRGTDNSCSAQYECLNASWNCLAANTMTLALSDSAIDNPTSCTFSCPAWPATITLTPV